MPPRPRHLWTALICLVLGLGTFALFAPATAYDFVNYDDPDYVTDNPMVQKGITGETIAWAFKQSYASNWHPLSWLSHMVDWSFHGAHAGGHHFTSVLFHAANAVLLFLVFQAATGSLWRSALVAALFATHPLRVESVAWISERKDVLSGFFFLLTLWAYIGYAKNRPLPQKSRTGGSPVRAQGETPPFPGQASRLSYCAPLATPRGARARLAIIFCLSLLCFALGLMSKPMLVTLPFVLLLLDFWPLQRMTPEPGRVTGKETRPNKKAPQPSRFTHLKPLLLEKIPFFALTIASCIVTYLAQKGEAMEHWDVLPLDRRLTNALISYVRYLGKTIWPSNLSVFYEYPDAWPAWQIIGAAVLLIAITALVLWKARELPWLAIGWFWYCGMLVPVIGIVQVGIQSIADRYLYLPGIGLLVAAVWSLPQWAERSKQFVLAGLSGLLVVACIILSAAQLRHWKNSETLFTHALAIYPNDVVAHVMLAAVLEKENKPGEAIDHYRAALKIKPGFPQMYYNIGNVLAGQKKFAEAADYYKQALQMRPDYPECEDNLGIVLDMQGKYAEAAEHYAIAMKSMPNDPDVHQNLANMLAAMGKLDDAIVQYQTAIQIRPESPEAHFNWGVTLARQKKFAEAAAHYTEALRLKPDYAAARQQLDALAAANRIAK